MGFVVFLFLFHLTSCCCLTSKFIILDPPDSRIDRSVLKIVGDSRASEALVVLGSGLGYQSLKIFGDRMTRSMKFRDDCLLVLAEVTERNIRDLLNITNKRPKILIVLKNKSGAEDILKYGWSKKFLDLTILCLGTEPGGWTFHPFEKKMMKIESHWFPEKLHNMAGHPMEIMAFSCSPYRYMRSRYSCSPALFRAPHPDYMKLEALSEMMNFTPSLSLIDTHEWLRNSVRMNRSTAIPRDLLDGRVDFLLTRIAGYSEKSNTLRYSTTAKMIKWCLTIPNTFEDKSPDLIVRFIVNSSIVLIVLSIIRFLCRLLEFDRGIWRIDRLFGSLFGVSWLVLPTRHVERVTFLFVIVALTKLTNHVYADLVGNGIKRQAKITFHNLEDLYRSRYSLVAPIRLQDAPINAKDPEIMEMLKRSWFSSNMTDCLETMMKIDNQTCVISSVMMDSIVNSRFFIKTRIKFTKLCFVSLPLLYHFNENSPYSGRVNDILLRLHSVGLTRKWDADYDRWLLYSKEAPFDVVEENAQNSSVYALIVQYLFGGYIFIVGVFIGEMACSIKLPRFRDICYGT